MDAARQVVGRESDLDSLRAALRSASGALVVGPAGVGKTHLVHSFLGEVAARGGRIETFVASQTTQQIPLGALSPVLAQAKLVNSSKFEQLTQAICALLGDSEESLAPALMFDDVDLLDAASADVVHQLASSRQASVWLTIRSGEPIPAPIESLWRSGNIHRIDLEPINRDCATRIAEGFLEGALARSAADALWDLTLGVPLYLREAVHDFVASGLLRQGKQGWEIDGPLEPGHRLQDLLLRRIERLSAVDRGLVEMVALAEPLAASLLSLGDQDAALKLVRRGLLQWRDSTTRDVLVSAHPLFASCT
ncbi:MAG: AAA family ATPase, partial [Actinobacteria bacterium]|nr:AAA family ATPase [Actinomycetota bacterium]